MPGHCVSSTNIKVGWLIECLKSLSSETFLVSFLAAFKFLNAVTFSYSDRSRSIRVQESNRLWPRKCRLLLDIVIYSP